MEKFELYPHIQLNITAKDYEEAKTKAEKEMEKLSKKLGFKIEDWELEDAD